jgi:electron transfer flavoprotein alpha subunit
MSVLAVAEHRRGEYREVSHQIASAGRELAEGLDEELHLAVVGGSEGFTERAGRHGVDVVHPVAAGESFNHDEYVQGLTQLAQDISPTVLLMPHTAAGMDYAPAVAGQLDRPLVTDVVGVSMADRLTVTRELYGSKVETTIAVEAEQAALTVRPGEWPAAEPGEEIAVEPFEPAIDAEAVHSTVTGYEEAGTGDVDITDADVLVSVGRGIDEEENLELIEDLAAALDATVSASRPIIDNGWLPADRQVGQSGKVVTPEVYLAIGISGAVQHVAGMKGAETVIAINTDPNAPIFDVADYGIVDDLFDVVPALIEEFGG